MKKAFLVCVMALVLISCQFITIIQPTTTPEPTNTFTPTVTLTITHRPTITTTPTPQTDCDPNVFVEELKPLVPYETFSLGYQIYQGERFLFFWIVDPALDPFATEDELRQNFDLAVEHSIDLSNLLNQANACVAEYFDYFNPIVVDRYYNGWFSGGINIDLLPVSGELSDANLEVVQEAIFDYGVWERTFVPEIQSIPAESCTWDEVEELVSRHFYDSVLNSYMLVADNNGITFTVQYATGYPDDYIGDAMTTYLNTEREVECLLPEVEYVFVSLVDEYGNVVYTESVPVDLYD
ncbi:MAG TPA: hypothetical protein VN376_03305 [Longilinea sp.]|nr:hypothetical protein [Longilinea sp.]